MHNASHEYEVDVQRYLVPTEELNSRGNPKCIPLIIRKMNLTRIEGRFGEDHLRIVQFNRHDQVFYCVSKLQAPDPEKCSLMKLRPDPPSKYKKVCTLSEEECLRYLQGLLGTQAICAMHELMTKEPERHSIG